MKVFEKNIKQSKYVNTQSQYYWRFVYVVIFCFFTLQSTIAQVGIGTTTPDASSVLDITATDKGMLVPRLTQAQKNTIASPANGLLIYQTNGATGFYYYNGTIWQSLTSAKNTLDQAYDEGGAGMGRQINADNGSVFILKNSASEGSALFARTTSLGVFDNKSAIHANNTFGGLTSKLAYYKKATASDPFGFYGLHVTSILSNYTNIHGAFYDFNVGNGSDVVGSRVRINSRGPLGASFNVFGFKSELSGASETQKYAFHASIPTTSNGVHYGFYADVPKNTGYAGYFIGRMSLGNTTSNRYLMPAADGTANQIMQTDGSGQVNFVDSSTFATDSQTIDSFSFNSTTNELTLEVENDGIAPQTVDLSSLATNNKALVRVTLSADQGIPNNSNTKVNFDSETYDLNSNYDTVTNRFTANEPGYYKINSTISTGQNSDGFELMIFVNGSLFSRYYPNIPSTGYHQSLSIQDVIFLNTNDYIEIYVYRGFPNNHILALDFDGAILSYLIIEQIR